MAKREKKTKEVDPNAQKKVDKHWRDTIAQIEKEGDFKPGPESPICSKCSMNICGGSKLYMPYAGSSTPTLTIVSGEISLKEDRTGAMGSDGPAGLLMRRLTSLNKDIGADLSQVRFISGTRCANVNKLKKNETAAKRCRSFMVADLMIHRPKLIMPIGTSALKLLSYKSDAGNWGGKTLTYRGWPDDWLTDPKFAEDHPIFGPRPTEADRIPMVPVQAPKLVFFAQNRRVIDRWEAEIKKVLYALKNGVTPKVYDRDWWHISEDADEVETVLKRLIELGKTNKLVLTYDTETTGLAPWKEGSAIVFMMLRWDDPELGKCAFGWPWQYAESPINKHRDRLGPIVMETLASHRLQGHNLTFDILFTLANTVPDGTAWINRICEAGYRDTWHMAYIGRAFKGSLGLELMAYEHAPDLAGYEEDFELLKDLTPEMNPEHGGHYAACPKDKWQTHLRPYVMGDVEVCHVSGESLHKKLESLPCYNIPISNPNKLGSFRWYKPLSRIDVYYKILTRANTVFNKMMARGMHINIDTVLEQEELFPKLINEAKKKIRESSPKIDQWCRVQEANDPAWMLDLENKTILKTIMFELMALPINSLTDSGMSKYKNVPISKIPRDELFKYASASKFTLSNLCVEHTQVRDILAYRSLHKQYTAFVRPMRNIVTLGIDKNARAKDQFIQRDGRVHSTFRIASTTTGRATSSNPNLQQQPRESIVKAMYGSRFGKKGCIYQADKSQIELRLLATASGDPAMVNAYLKDIDLHSQTTSLLFNIPYEHFGDEYTEWLQKNDKSKEAKDLKTKRKVGKTANFLTGYGGGAKGLQTSLATNGLYMTEAECQRLLDIFFESYSTLKLHIGVYKKFILEKGCAVSLFGRIRPLEEAFSEDMGLQSKATRNGYNHLIQSSAADMMYMALIMIEDLMREAKLESVLVSTVHDSLVADVLLDELPAVHEICTGVMNNMPDVIENILGPEFDSSWCRILPFECDAEVGWDYLNAKSIPKKGDVDWGAILKAA